MSTQKDLHTYEQNEKNEKTDYDPPEDHFYINYILFFLIGLVHSLPGTFFTTATNVSTFHPYYLSKTTELFLVLDVQIPKHHYRHDGL